uniref:hypothetical protein n=1 Tax=Amycolatopsis sp. CA-096443 TaxID=3239919 RepID=UPI003F493BDF
MPEHKEPTDGLVAYGPFLSLSGERWASPEAMADEHLAAAAAYKPDLVAEVRDDPARRGEFADLLAEDIVRSINAHYSRRASGPAPAGDVVLRREDNMFAGPGPVPGDVKEAVGEAIGSAALAAGKLFGYVLVGLRPPDPLF